MVIGGWWIEVGRPKVRNGEALFYTTMAGPSRNFVIVMAITLIARWGIVDDSSFFLASDK